jgi:hypothetical protein
LVHAAPVSRAAVAAAAALRVVGTVRGGTVNLNLDALSERGIPVFNTPGRNAQAVAEFVAGALIAHVRGIVPAATALRAGRWSMTRGRSPAPAWSWPARPAAWSASARSRGRSPRSPVASACACSPPTRGWTPARSSTPASSRSAWPSCWNAPTWWP